MFHVEMERWMRGIPIWEQPHGGRDVGLFNTLKRNQTFPHESMVRPVSIPPRQADHAFLPNEYRRPPNMVPDQKAFRRSRQQKKTLFVALSGNVVFLFYRFYSSRS